MVYTITTADEIPYTAKAGTLVWEYSLDALPYITDATKEMIVTVDADWQKDTTASFGAARVLTREANVLPF